jgi:WD40 repeat protein
MMARSTSLNLVPMLKNLLLRWPIRTDAPDTNHGSIVAIIYDINSGAALTSSLKNDEMSLVYTRFTDDGKHLVTISEKGTVVVWEGQTGKRKSIHIPSGTPVLGTPAGRARIRG